MIRSSIRFLLVLISFLFGCNSLFAFGKQAKEIYEIRMYTLKSNEQVAAMDMYLKNALIPALHRAGIHKVGVFKTIGLDTALVKNIYVLIPANSLNSWEKLHTSLDQDATYKNDANFFTHAGADKAPYQRLQTIITEAFPMHPSFEIPVLQAPKSERVYELRSYESPTEHLYERKVTMFNQGDEVGLFKRLNFNAVFYSSVIAGNKMPNLMYMISFENMADHDAHWKQFGNDPQWKKISTMPEYENKVSVSHIDSILMHPTDYSDI